MESLILIGNVLLPLFYFITTFTYAKVFYKQEAWAKKWARPLLSFTLSFHFGEFLLRSLYLKQISITSTAEAASVLVWTIGVTYLYLELRLKIQNTGYFVLVFLFFLTLFASSHLSLKENQLLEEAKGVPFFLHVFFALFGYTCLSLSAIYSFLYLLLFYDLKKNRFTLLYERLPPLEVLGEVNLKAVQLGFLVLSISTFLGILLGRILSKSMAGDAKVWFTFFTLAVYGLEILGYFFFRWSKRKLAILSLTGFFLLLFSFLIVNHLWTDFHAF